MSKARITSTEGKIDHTVEEAILVIGRSKTADLRIDHPSVSSRHCQISRVNEYYAIHDLGSKNGTHVNGSRITQSYLSSGDLIQLGEVVLRFDADSLIKTRPPLLSEASGGEVEDGLITTMERIATTAETAHYYRHSDLVMRLAVEVGEEVGLSGKDLRSLRLAAVLHDMGMLRIPGDVLKKAGPLTKEERKEIERHPIYSLDTISDLNLPEGTKAAIRGHHERWDGSGYPDGLAGEKIPRLARILSIAGATAAMLSHRSFRPKSVPSDVVKELEGGAGTQFDPQLVPVIIKVVKSLEGPATARM